MGVKILRWGASVPAIWSGQWHRLPACDKCRVGIAHHKSPPPSQAVAQGQQKRGAWPDATRPSGGFDLLLIAGLVFFVDLLLVFLRLFGFLLAFILLTFVSHSFLLRFFDLCSSFRLLNLGQFFFLGVLGRHGGKFHHPLLRAILIKRRSQTHT